MKIRIHSFVDVITNSSTVIYVQAGNKSIELMKEFIDEILSIAGSDKKACDLFEFKLQADKGETIEKLAERFDELEDSMIKLGYTKGQFDEQMSADEIDSDILEQLYTAMDNGEIDKIDGWGNNYDDMNTESLVLIPKSDDKNVIDITAKIQKIFDIDGSYNG